MARRTDEPGKGMKWKIADKERDDFIKKQVLNPRKGGGGLRLDSSGPNSPAFQPPSQATERLVGALGHHDIFGKQEPGTARIKSPPRSATPPLTAYPMANESYTPDRGPRSHIPFGGFKQSPTHKEQVHLTTPAKRLFQDSTAPGAPIFPQSSEALETTRQLEGSGDSPNAEPSQANVAGLRERAANSPPPLYSDTPASNGNGAQDGGRMHNPGLVTPLVPRHAPRLAPPSTAHVPSQYITFSSPAPFWKFIDLPSTPAKGTNLDVSPIKVKKDEDGDKDGEDEAPQPSSPPMVVDEDNTREHEDREGEEEENKGDEEDDMGPDSPSRTLSRPVSRREFPGSQRSRSNSNVNGFVGGATSGGMVRGASLGSFEEEPEEEGFDLAK